MPMMLNRPMSSVNTNAPPVRASQPPFGIEPTTGNASARWSRQLMNATNSITMITSHRTFITQVMMGPAKSGPCAARAMLEDYPGGYRVMQYPPRRRGLLAGRGAGALGRHRLGVRRGLVRDLTRSRLGGAGAAPDDLLAPGDQVGVDLDGLLLGHLGPGDERLHVAL